MLDQIQAVCHIWMHWIRGHRKFLYIPYEILQRELHGNIVLAATARHSGFITLLGQKRAVFPIIPFLPRGTFYLKSIVPGEVQIQRAIRGCGHFNVSLDVEGLTMSNGLSGVFLRYSKASIELVDCLFFWGEAQRQRVLDAMPSAKDKAIVTGSPIADWWGVLAGFSGREDSPKAILFATSFPIVNHPLGIDYYNASLLAAAPDALRKRRAEFELDAALQAAVFPTYQQLLKEVIAHFPDTKILLRPHPTEIPDVWEDVVANAANVEMAIEKDIGTYLSEVDVFIHFNSTAAIQAIIQGVTAVSLLPTCVTQEMRARMSEPVIAVSEEYSQIDTLVDAVSTIINKKSDAEQQTIGSVAQFVDMAPGQIDHSARRIVGEIDGLYTYSVSEERSSFMAWCDAVIQLSMRSAAVQLLQNISSVLPLRTPGMKRWRDSAQYGRMKRSKIKIEDIGAILVAISKMENYPAQTVKFKCIGSALILILQ